VGCCFTHVQRLVAVPWLCLLFAVALLLLEMRLCQHPVALSMPHNVGAGDSSRFADCAGPSSSKPRGAQAAAAAAASGGGRKARKPAAAAAAKASRRKDPYEMDLDEEMESDEDAPRYLVIDWIDRRMWVQVSDPCCQACIGDRLPAHACPAQRSWQSIVLRTQHINPLHRLLLWTMHVQWGLLWCRAHMMVDHVRHISRKHAYGRTQSPCTTLALWRIAIRPTRVL
jgi:hypothetical protein